ncbi:hypothetical protein Glove_138g54 [Diversispora epigaea]|uniref:Uncharacterized protein n=1 Tax=Diversispora epigaea TaxID=1348612 RepID=A0A397J2L7_9GLOM|nr:hypothetical protein Glove_138g54 [Diversispora epigaea]
MSFKIFFVIYFVICFVILMLSYVDTHRIHHYNQIINKYNNNEDKILCPIKLSSKSGLVNKCQIFETNFKREEERYDIHPPQYYKHHHHIHNSKNHSNYKIIFGEVCTQPCQTSFILLVTFYIFISGFIIRHYILRKRTRSNSLNSINSTNSINSINNINIIDIEEMKLKENENQ